MTIRIFGFSVDMNPELLIFNEIPFNKCKLLNDDQKKMFFCILNAYKATLYGLFYLRPVNITGEFLLHKLQMNVNVARKIALDSSLAKLAALSRNPADP